MNHTLQKTPPDTLGIFEPTDRGVVGLADDLLQLCRDGSIFLNWQANGCRVRFPANTNETYDVPLTRTVFRALLARVAALCNEHRPNSVSPYGGMGELRVGIASPEQFQVTFTNTSTEQELLLLHVKGK